MKLEIILQEWLGQEHILEGNIRHQCGCGSPIVCEDHNRLLKDLKSKIPDLIEQLTLKGERRRIIEMIRSDERGKLIEEIEKFKAPLTGLKSGFIDAQQAIENRLIDSILKTLNKDASKE